VSEGRPAPLLLALLVLELEGLAPAAPALAPALAPAAVAARP